ncbi:MAG: DUF2339 domain-containing protein [Victivallales bacterium]|nr:DUF2339 domain-containing protein [Victivallales bacterium]
MQEFLILCCLVFIVLLVILLTFTYSLMNRISELNGTLERLAGILKRDKSSEAVGEKPPQEAPSPVAETAILSAEAAFPSLAAATAPKTTQETVEPQATAEAKPSASMEPPKQEQGAGANTPPLAEPAPIQQTELQAIVEELQEAKQDRAAAQPQSASSEESSVSENAEESPQDHHGFNGTPFDRKYPREPSAVERRLKMLCNWLVYGSATGVAEGESAEKMLATTWLLRSGILVILFTSIFLLKLSIDKGILAPTGRVVLSYLAGAALLLFGLSKRMRERYWSLGQALCGISLGVFYFSSFAMTSMYHLVSAVIGGAVMCITTMTAGVLADKLNSLTVGMVAMFGGYATPLLLNTGVKNFPGLSAYLMLLGIGVLWLAYRRNWLQLTWLAMAFTYALFAMAVKTHYVKADFAVCQTALCLFFILFSTTVFVHNVRKRLPANALEIWGLLCNSTLFFGLSWWIISSVNHGDKLFYAPLTLGLAAYYLAHAIFFERRHDEALRGLLLIFCALSGFYLALTFPVVLSGEWLAAAWALQAFMMLWLGHKLDSRLVRCCAWILYALTLLHLVCYEFWGYRTIALAQDGFSWSSVISRLFQYMLPIGSLAAAAQLTMKRKAEAPAESEPTSEDGEENPMIPRPRTVGETLAGILFGLSFVVLFLFLRFEIGVDLHRSDFWLTGINIVWIGGCIVSDILLKKGLPGLWRVFLAFLLGGTLLRGVMDFFNDAFWRWAYPQFDWSGCLCGICNTAVLVIGLMLCAKMMPKGKRERTMNLICRVSWPILLFIHSTREWGLIIKHKLPGLSGGGISILWALFAFVMVFRGITKSVKILRHIGLLLFAVVVCKVFLFDMSHLEAIYRVIAFFVFGVLLMGAAFVYLKFWHNKEER